MFAFITPIYYHDQIAICYLVNLFILLFAITDIECWLSFDFPERSTVQTSNMFLNVFNEMMILFINNFIFASESFTLSSY